MSACPCRVPLWRGVRGLLLSGAGMLGPAVLAQEAAEPSRWARYEVGLMILAVIVILILGGGLLRALMHLGMVRRVAWLVPILMGLTGLGWSGVHVLGLTEELPRALALLEFLCLSLAFVTVLAPLGRLVLPERVHLTRGGVPPLLRAVALAMLAFIGIFVLLTWSFPNLNLTPVFLTSGAFSIVLGLAVQDLLSNLLAGVVMSLERPFKLGDWVRIGEIEGDVVNIAWRTTTVRTRDNDCVIIPNNVSVREKVTNYEMPSPVHLLRIPIGVSYETPCGVVAAALEEAASRVLGVLETPAAQVHFCDYLDSALLYELRAYIDNYESIPAIRSDLNKQIWYAFKRYGITIPFPQRDVHLYSTARPVGSRQARLVATRGPLRGTMVSLEGAELTVGRGVDCTVCIPDPSVSTHHASIAAAAEGHRLRDAGSRRGTQLNGRPVRSAMLRQGDEIGIGPVTFVYEVLWRNEGQRGDVVPAEQPAPDTNARTAGERSATAPPAPDDGAAP
ncbi:MAG: mechanosensitive ion channel [Lentisphaeria bacterium]|nr:mechanosensitive ion channel [Lentisphaeria bacterium]